MAGLKNAFEASFIYNRKGLYYLMWSFATPFDASSLSAKHAKALARSFRSNSLAFMGSKTVESLQKILNDPLNQSSIIDGIEAPVAGVIMNTKEIIFHQIEGITERRSMEIPNIDKQLDKVLSTEQQAFV